MAILHNTALLSDPRRQQYLIIERWAGIDARADYYTQAKAMRRQLDAVEYVERAHADGKVIMAHMLAGGAGTAILVSVKSNEELGDFIKSNPANARMRPADRTVVPMSNWDEGREAFMALIRNVEQLANEEREAESEGRVRPFADKRLTPIS